VTTNQTKIQGSTVFIVSGYPGAGKTFVGKLLAELINGKYIESGTVVREGAREHFNKPIEDISSKQLGEYSTMRRERDGGDYIIQDLLDRLEKAEDFPERPVVISGLRDSEAIPLVESSFEEFEIIWVEADFETRLHRLQGRGRQDESEYTREQLNERDERERDWGTESMNEASTMTVDNSEVFEKKSEGEQHIKRQLEEKINI
jgi:dephospho-CoA kinase